MNKIKKYIRNRYGVDQLGKVTGWLAILFYALALITKVRLLSVFAYVFFFLFLVRALSSIHYARQQENERFLRKLELIKMKFHDRKDFRYYECKCCFKILRMPRGKGKVEIRCPKCGTKIVKRT